MSDGPSEWVAILMSITGGSATTALIAGAMSWRATRAAAVKSEIEVRALEESKRLREVEDAAEWQRSLNERVKMLLDGYVSQIKELTLEVSGLRQQVNDLQTQLRSVTAELHSLRLEHPVRHGDIQSF